VTRRQIQTLRFVARWLAEHEGESPSLQEIADGLGLSSLSSVHGKVRALRERGMIVKLDGVSRSIELTERGKLALTSSWSGYGR
jgi:repressor LexA